MSNPQQPGDEGGTPTGDPLSFSLEVQHSSASARVPEKVARGVFSTGVLVLEGPSEFILDFLQRMSQPHQLVARVVVPISILPRLIHALRDNLENFRKAFGPPPPLPTPPPPAQPPSVEQIYNSLKAPEEVLSGVYANGAFISHSALGFCFDFIASFYPRATVSARVFLTPSGVPVMLNSLAQAWHNHEAKRQRQEPPRPPAE
jgi:hypothetical protein